MGRMLIVTWKKMKSILKFLKNEIVLTVAAILAVISSFLVTPDREYLGYVDFRTLALLFCLMTVMAGFQRLGVFRRIAEGLLRRVGTGSVQVILALVFLCFFFSMLITNDVALITFVPFTFTVLELLGEERRERLVVPLVVLETLGANLGSMLTPLGNPQNLYLYGKAGLDMGEFMAVMLPYSCISGILLAMWGVIAGKRHGGQAKAAKMMSAGQEDVADIKQELEGTEVVQACTEDRSGLGFEKQSRPDGENQVKLSDESGMKKGRIILLLAYVGLFLLSLLTVVRVIPYPATLLVTLVLVLILDRRTLLSVDYSLLLTFVAFFLFIGNMGRIPAFADLLAESLQGREVVVAVLASQAISNVPAALLLSGFTDRYGALIIGVNLGGLGTLIASMASLISYKYVARLMPEKKGKYFGYFTIANLVFLAILLTANFILERR